MADGLVGCFGAMSVLGEGRKGPREVIEKRCMSYTFLLGKLREFITPGVMAVLPLEFL